MRLTQDFLAAEVMDAQNTTYLTHNFHPYAAKFIPQLPRFMIKSCTNEGETVLDPFCGCGTTLVEAKLLNRQAVGVDLNPIAVLSSKVKCTKLANNEIADIKEILRQIRPAIQNAYQEDDFRTQIYFPNRDHWFQKPVLKEIDIIKEYADQAANEKIENFLKLGLSAILVSVSNQESETRYASINKHILPLQTFNNFASKIVDMVGRIREFNQIATDSETTVHRADSKRLQFLDSDVVDLIVTSPPYANTYDYYLYHKLRMHVLGYAFEQVRDREIGSRNRHSSKRESIQTFQRDLLRCFESFHRVLKSGGMFAIVIGDSIINKNFIDAFELTTDLAAQTGFQHLEHVTYSLNSVSKTFNAAFRNKTKNEHVVMLENIK